ncbi:tetratricopeptide repeat protein [Streptomyces europaeiscabiei]|uniref:tetratricopeptide repeat protein n=1 Tax=Streptomyces europaeiscabiei TaxID=146819 RepID=UPI002E2A952F|nr:tetratricopeptide repeat protein [Streptomyces europaeiscabiei]
MDHLEHSPSRDFFSGRAENQGRVFQQQSGVQINADSFILANLAEAASSSPMALPFTAVRVDEVTATELGVHHAAADAAGDLPPYVERQIDKELRTRISRIPRTGEPILIVGDSTAGKTRAAFEALKECFSNHLVFAPYDGHDLVSSLPSLVESKKICVLWLDNLERYIGPEGLTPQVLGLLRRARIPIISTMRAEQYRQLVPAVTQYASTSNDERINLGRRILEQIHVMVLTRLWAPEEIERARRVDDARVQGAVAFSTHYGVAEYLAAGPRLYQEWILAWGPGINPRGAALVAAAVDCVRAGITHAVTRELLVDMHEAYLARVGGAVLRPEAIEEAFEWATSLRFGVTSLLMPAAEHPGRFKVFDYLADEFMRSNASQSIPHDSWRIILEFAKDDNSTYLVGLAAETNGETEIAEEAWRESASRGSGKALLHLGLLYLNTDREAEAVDAWAKAVKAGESMAYAPLGIWHRTKGETDKAVELFREGAERNDVFAIRGLAESLETAEEAEQWWIKLVEMEDGADDRYNLAYYYFVTDRKELARKKYLEAAEKGSIPAMNNYGAMIADDDIEEAEKWFRLAHQKGSWQAATNLAMDLIDRGAELEAESLLKEAVKSDYLRASSILGSLYYKQGKPEQAKATWIRGVENEDEWSIYNLGLFFENDGFTDKAAGLYRRIADFNDDAAESLGTILATEGRADEAMQLLERVKEKITPQGRCALGSAFLHGGCRHEIAKYWYESSLDAGHAHAGCWLGEMAFGDGLHEDAERYYRTSFNGGHQHAADRMSHMLVSLGKGKEAAHWLRLAKGLPPVPGNRSLPARKRRRKKRKK